MVLAKDENNPSGKTEYKKVLNLFQRTAEEGTITLFIGKEKIETTAGHPFWVDDKGWVTADKLIIGDILTTYDGLKLEINDIIVSKKAKVVYNFEVEDFHTYFVTSTGIWTHNKGVCPPDWKDKIVLPSKPHTNKTPGHWFASLRKAVEEAKKTTVEKVYLNKGLRNEVPNAPKNNRPDVMVKNSDGTIDQYEVPSRTDDPLKLINRMQQNQQMMGNQAGDYELLQIKKKP